MPNNHNNQNNQKPQTQQTQGNNPQTGQNAPGRNQDIGSKDKQASRVTDNDQNNPRRSPGGSQDNHTDTGSSDKKNR